MQGASLRLANLPRAVWSQQTEQLVVFNGKPGVLDGPVVLGRWAPPTCATQPSEPVPATHPHFALPHGLTTCLHTVKLGQLCYMSGLVTMRSAIVICSFVVNWYPGEQEHALICWSGTPSAGPPPQQHSCRQLFAGPEHLRLYDAAATHAPATKAPWLLILPIRGHIQMTCACACNTALFRHVFLTQSYV